MSATLKAFNESDELNEYAVEKINLGGFDFIDDIRNHYHVVIITNSDFNLLQYGSTEVDINMTPPTQSMMTSYQNRSWSLHQI